MNHPRDIPIPHATAVTTITFAGPLEDKLRIIANAGFMGVELFECDVIRFPGTRQDVRALCDELRLEIVAYQFEGSMSLPRVRRRCENMQELRVGLMVVTANALLSLEIVREAVEIAAEFGIRIALDPVSWGQELKNWQQALHIVETVNHPGLGLVLDSFNILTSDVGASGIERIPKERIFHVHLSDAPALKMDPRLYSRHHRNFPGQGALDVHGFMKLVKKTGYTGPLSLEVYNDEIRAAPNHRTARDGLRSLMSLMDEVYGGVLPPAPEVMGIEAIEFAVVEKSVPQLERYLRDVGLRMVARHVEGDVSVFSGGGVNIIINSEPESYASISMVFHNCAVSAMAIRVKNIQQAVDRATALGCLVIPPKSRQEAVYKLHAPDGRCYIYLVDQQQMWKRDFRFAPDENGPAHPYVNIDHIGHALDRLSMDRFVLFFSSIFGMSPQQTFELADPFGMIMSRALVTPNNALRFPLNVSDDRETSIGRLIRNSAGTVVHHIAISTSDIFATAASLRKDASQNRVLRMPQYYYEDITVRYGLNADFVARLNEHDIMYDRDEHGEFLHFSTEQFADQFFFEIVQRNSGYTGFGNVNAPIRMNLHHERRNLALRDGSIDGSPKRMSTGPDSDKGIVAIFPPGCEPVVKLIGVILGKSVGFGEAAVSSGAGVVGLPLFSAPSILPSLNPNKFISLHLLRVDLDPLGNIPSISSLCTYEYIFSLSDLSRRDFARFLTFITGQSTSHDTIMAKPRSTFIPLNFPDVRPALSSLDILTIGADAIEFRVDYLREGPSTSGYNPLPRLLYIGHQLSLLRARTELPIIFSLRSQPEGGRCPDASNQTNTHEILLKGLQWGCEFIDVEILLPTDVRNSLASRRNHTRIMGSYHDLIGRLKWSTDEPSRLYHTSRSFADITKIVGFAVSQQDNHELEQFRARVVKTFPHPFLGINAGAPGQLSRILNPFFTPITHPMLPVAVAPGQLSAAEINRARHIIGLEPKKTLFTIGFDPELWFLRKCINELELPHSYTALPPISARDLSSLARRIEFGGALIRPAISTIHHLNWLENFSDTAREVGEVDAIVARTSGTQSILIGECVAAKVLLDGVLRERAPSALMGKMGLIIANDKDDARVACWVLRKVGVGVVWTVGFRAESDATMTFKAWRKRDMPSGTGVDAGGGGSSEGMGVVAMTDNNAGNSGSSSSSGNGGNLRFISIIISALREENRALLKPLVGLVKEENQLAITSAASSSAPSNNTTPEVERELVVLESRGEEAFARLVERGVEALIGMRVAAEVGWVGGGGAEWRNGG